MQVLQDQKQFLMSNPLSQYQTEVQTRRARPHMGLLHEKSIIGIYSSSFCNTGRHVLPCVSSAGDSWAPGCLIGINRRIYGPSWCDLLKWHYDAVNGRQRQVRHKVATGKWKMSPPHPPPSQPDQTRPGQAQALPRLPIAAPNFACKWVTFADAICYTKKGPRSHCTLT